MCHLTGSGIVRLSGQTGGGLAHAQNDAFDPIRDMQRNAALVSSAQASKWGLAELQSVVVSLFAALRFRPYGPAPTYWITRSARLSTSGGIVTPMSRAVLRSTISS